MLTCETSVLVPYTITPRTVNFGRVPRSTQSRQKTFTLTRGDGGPLAPELLPTGNNIEAELAEVEPGEMYELTLTIKPPWPNGQLRGSVRFKTGVPEVPQDSIQIYAQIEELVKAVPERLAVQVGAPEETEYTISVVHAENEPIQILSAQVNQPLLKTEVEERSGRQVVVVRAPASFDPGARRNAVLTIRTDSKVAPTLRVPIMTSRRPVVPPRTPVRNTSSVRPPTSQPAETSGSRP